MPHTVCDIRFLQFGEIQPRDELTSGHNFVTKSTSLHEDSFRNNVVRDKFNWSEF